MDYIYNRNIKELNNKTGEKIKKNIEQFILIHEKYKKCYFWTVNMPASQRRQQEFDNRLEFFLNNIKYEWRQYLEISCKNFYYTSQIFVNGQKKDVRIFKKLIKE